MVYEIITVIDFKKRLIAITRDNYGKFYVDINSRPTQKRLNAREIVRYLSNMMHDNSLDNDQS